jgi:hypothetical protein
VDTWPETCRPIILPESDLGLEQWREMKGRVWERVAGAKAIAVARYRLVIEDVPESCSSESSAEYSDHWDELTGMYTSDMLDQDGQPILARDSMTMEEASRLRKQGRAGVQDTVSGTGRQDV